MDRGSLQCSTKTWVDVPSLSARPRDALPIELVLGLLHMPSPFTFAACSTRGAVLPTPVLKGALDAYLRDKLTKPTSNPVNEDVSLERTVQVPALGTKRTRQQSEEEMQIGLQENPYNSELYEATAVIMQRDWNWIIEQAGGVSRGQWIRNFFHSTSRNTFFCAQWRLVPSPA
mmetsp:Transcript_28483/g.44559  ORF Transcript_28483/g.44559 Transcript_28483/m.44559 type:complete len:173 (-) Transcript_28483:286-804(-)